MKRNRNSDHEKSLVNIKRPILVNLNTQVTDNSVNEIRRSEIIDLCTPERNTMEDTKAVTATVKASPSSSGVVMEKLPLASTITIERCSNLEHRLSILPLYPISDAQHHGYPLLVNIPSDQLTQTELLRRHSGTFKPAFDIMNRDLTIPSFLREKYHLFFGDLIERLKVDMTILDFNYTRLNKYMKMLIYQQVQIFNLRPHEIQLIHEKEYPLALEFFLQFDIHIFYMKTCSFRFARPRSLNEGLFCLREPEARYQLAECGNCALCYPQYDRTYRLQKSIIQFSQAHMHKFVNGYQTILNCSASCHTCNIIYALTCPCGKVDYIGATMYSLHDRLKKHRQHGNRIMHEFLLGQENILRDLPRPKSKEIIAKDRMKLYQHSAHCPVAMQLFLDANPRYWRFVPMSIEEAQTPEQQHIQRPQFSEELNWNLRSKEDSLICINAVPKPPSAYTFSNRQILLQTTYFHKKQDQILPNQDLDLYNATIVAVLPETCSNMFRYTIESLFTTYAEANLNSIGNVLKQAEEMNYYPLDNPWLIRGDEWCQGLVRRPKPKTSIVNTVAPST